MSHPFKIGNKVFMKGDEYAVVIGVSPCEHDGCSRVTFRCRDGAVMSMYVTNDPVTKIEHNNGEQND